MAKRGRKRKQGRREPSGRIQRKSVLQVAPDRGTDAMQAKAAMYGSHGTDAIGRAYMAGLLGQIDSASARAMLDTARKLSRDYHRAYEQAPYKGTLADRTGGSVIDLDHARIRQTEERLREALHMVDRMGRQVRLAFYSLVIEQHPDSGPPWLENMIWAKRTGKPPHPAAQAFLKRALAPLDILANGG